MISGITLTNYNAPGYEGALVGTPRCGVPTSAVAGGIGNAGGTNHGIRCAAERGADSAARCPYQTK